MAFYSLIFLGDTSLAVSLPVHIQRYFDQGLSYTNVVALCDYAGVTTIEFYWKALTSFGGFNPAIEFYEASKMSAGYNLTPTVFGDLACGAPIQVVLQVIFTLLFLHVTLWAVQRVTTNLYLQRFFVFIQLGVLHSTVFDLLKFSVLAMSVVVALEFIRKMSGNTNSQTEFNKSVN